MVDAAMTNPEGSAAQFLPLLYEVPGHFPVVHIVHISLKRELLCIIIHHLRILKNENLEKVLSVHVQCMAKEMRELWVGLKNALCLAFIDASRVQLMRGGDTSARSQAGDRGDSSGVRKVLWMGRGDCE
jgi:hypothetical protein